MLKRIITSSLLMAGSIFLLITSENFLLELFYGIISFVSLIYLINKTSLFHREKPYLEEEPPKLFDERLGTVISQKGNRKAVLLIHGFSSNPWLFHKHIPLFEKAGYDVIAPRLPGHGTSPQEFLKTGFTHYYGCVEKYLIEYRPQYDYLHLIGISMGGLLSLKIAEEYSGTKFSPDSLTTLAAPAKMKDKRLWLIRILSWIKPLFKGEWDPQRESDGGEDWIGYNDLFVPQAYSLYLGMVNVRENLKKITIPHFLIHAKGDVDVPFENVYEIASSTSSNEQQIWVPDLTKWNHSRHALFLYDSLKYELSSQLLGFMKSRESKSSLQRKI